ncbi:GNAT family N-acetyltransferase [Ornithinimicrobium sp. W1665]
MERVLVTCDDDNAGSARVVEACGGVLEDVRTVAGHPPARRYWITT